ncbi:MAG: dienelactone hydrolase family protein [Deltaproteobacteria bacterium]|nr:dienelactone hydrolase family protein [Deltaproteobacteria bacterium]
MNLIHTIFEPEGTGPHPTLLTLHGFGANALDLLGLAPHLCGGQFLMLCPQGPLQVSLGGGAVGYGWYPFVGSGMFDMQAVLTAREELQAFLQDALQRYPIDSRKLAVLGFSQGGVMAYSLALGEPDRFAALAVLSSWLPKDLLSMLPDVPATEQLPVLVQHGGRDELVDVGRARQSVETLRDLRVPVTYREYEMGHEINARSLGDLSAWLQEKVLSPIVLAS